MIVPEEKQNPDSRKALLESRLNDIREKQTREKYSLLHFITIFLLFIIFTLLFRIINGDSIDEIIANKELFAIQFFGSLFLALIFFFMSPLLMNDLYRAQERSIMGELAIIGSEKLQDKIQEDFFTNLVKINFKYIDKYYLQTQIQADKSFTVSIVTSIVAFLIIIAGIILMLLDKVNSAYVATATGVVSEFIAAVFFYLYNKTIVKMGEYHHKLVLTQNISLALKITEQMPAEERLKAQIILIEQLTKDINLHLASKDKI